MKRKAQDTSGAEGRTRRSSSVGRCASRAQTIKESKGLALPGVTSKKEENEGLRRSSRRAAIQRRIWSSPKRNNPKKPAASIPRIRIIPAPERGQGKSNKKGKEKKDPPIPCRPSGRPPKTTVATKRPLIDTNDSLLSTTKRKVRRKEETSEIVKEDKVKASEKAADYSKNLVRMNSLQNHVIQTSEIKCQIENAKQESANRLKEVKLEFSQESGLEEGILSMKDDVKSPKDQRYIEELVVPEEVSMHKAVVLEIVSDYETSCESGEGSFFQQSTHKSIDSEISDSHKVDFKVSPVEHYCNIEPELSSDKCTNDNQTDVSSFEKEIETKDSKVVSEESGDLSESEGETGREKTDIYSPDLNVQSEPVTLICAQNNHKKDYSEEIRITDENPVELKIRDTKCDVGSDLPITDDDHVDLSVALAQLVEADGNKESDNGSQDIVTIHSAVPDEQGNLLTHCQVQEAEKIKTWSEERKACEEEEEDEGELVIREDAEEIASISSEDEPSKAVDMHNVEDNENAENEDPCVQDLWLEESKNTELEMRVIKPKTRKQIPPLIKITTRPPVIKTPLKCPECPMQFCTVRSLLWHFGTHGARSTDVSLAPILLQDLVVPWDNPTVPVTAAVVQEGDKTLSERNSFSPIAFLGEPAIPKKDAMQISDPPKVSEPFTTESVKIPEPTKGVTAVSSEEGPSNYSSDVILKVPIRRLKPPLVSIQNKFINILPKVKSSIAPQIQAPPTFQSPSTIQPPKMLMPPASSRESVRPLHIPPKVNVPQIKITTSKPTNHIQLQSLSCTTAPKVQLQPIAPSSTKCTTSTSNHITLIPMDKLSSVSHVNTSTSKVNPVPVRMVAPTQVPFKVAPNNSSSNDKDGLVMINPNLALRIVSSIPTSTETNMTSTTSTTIRPISSLPGLSQPEGLTILPQVEGGNFMSSYKKDTTPKPDILTIVPQVDMSKQAPPAKEEPAPKASTPVFGTSTKVPTSAPNSPQVVKFVFLQPKEICMPSGGGKGTSMVKTTSVEGSQLKKRALNTMMMMKKKKW